MSEDLQVTCLIITSTKFFDGLIFDDPESDPAPID